PVVTESADVELSTESVSLVERAVKNDGTAMLKLISPGKGSSGYYSEDVLKKAVQDKVFSKGLHNLIDHPTAQDESALPEGSIDNLASTLKEDAIWLDTYEDAIGTDQGSGVYAPATVVPEFREKL